MNDIDDILSLYGIPSNNSASQSQEELQAAETGNEENNDENMQEGQENEGETTVQDSLIDDDLDSILQEYGFSQSSQSATDEDSGSLEEHQDMETNNVYDENQGEGHDAEIEGHALENEEGSAEEDNTDSQGNDESLLPLNSPTLLLDESTSRFSGAEWYNEIQKSRIIFAGLGGIGSHAVFNIARMTPAALVLYDDDVVDTVNMSGQLYGWNDVSLSKADALVKTIKDYTSARNIYAIKDKFTADSEAGDIMMCGFDSMAARQTFFHSWKRHIRGKTEEEKSKCLFLDGRLSLTVLQVLCITGNDDYNISRYEKEFLFSDAEADETVCSMKQTTYLASMIGAMMTNLFTNFIANTLQPVIPYALPFFTEYDAQYMIFKTEN